MDISTGQPETHQALLPLNGAESPAVAGVTPVAGQMTSADQTPARDLTGERLGQLAGYAQDITAAQHAGMTAEDDRRSGYAADMLPLGAEYGDLMNLPPVPAYTMPPPPEAGYPDQGDEPVSAA